MIKLAYVSTSPLSARYLMTGQLADMRAHGFDVTLFCAGGADLDFVAEREGVKVVPIPIVRDIAPLQDLRALWRLLVELRRLRPTIVNAGTPKAALLGSIAAALLRVPVRIYVLRGLRSETSRGVKRWLLERLEWLTCALVHRVVVVSDSLRETYIRRRLVKREKTIVLGSGSSNGVIARRFAVDSSLRRDLGLESDRVIGFVGRLTRDKGIENLVAALDRIPRAKLLVIGDAEAGDPVDPATLERLRTDPRIVRVPHVTEIAPYYGVMDVLAFPSYREGFPNVILEAACAGVPAVGFRATGTVDAIRDGVTGTIVPRGDDAALADALARYLDDDALRRAHGDAARERAIAEFAPERIWEALRALYREEAQRRAADRLA